MHLRAPSSAATDGDAEIVRLLRTPEETGVRRLLAAHGGLVAAGLRSRFGQLLDDSELDDIMNTATYRVWRRADRFDPAKGGLREWFFVVAKNAALELLRARRRRARELGGADFEEIEEPVKLIPRVSSALLDVLRECVDALPGKQRRIIEADLQNGDVVSGKELAASLGTSANSVYVLRSLARKALRLALQARGCEPRWGGGGGSDEADGEMDRKKETR